MYETMVISERTIIVKAGTRRELSEIIDFVTKRNESRKDINSMSDVDLFKVIDDILDEKGTTSDIYRILYDWLGYLEGDEIPEEVFSRLDGIVSKYKEIMEELKKELE